MFVVENLGRLFENQIFLFTLVFFLFPLLSLVNHVTNVFSILSDHFLSQEDQSALCVS